MIDKKKSVDLREIIGRNYVEACGSHTEVQLVKGEQYVSRCECLPRTIYTYWLNQEVQH